jgi:hypothetical protein
MGLVTSRISYRGGWDRSVREGKDCSIGAPKGRLWPYFSIREATSQFEYSIGEAGNWRASGYA